MQVGGGYYFGVRSGYVSIYNGWLNNAGRNGDYWSSTASSTTSTAYEFNFNASSVNPSNGSANRNAGLSLRCMRGGSVRS